MYRFVFLDFYMCGQCVFICLCVHAQVCMGAKCTCTDLGVLCDCVCVDALVCTGTHTFIHLCLRVYIHVDDWG